MKNTSALSFFVAWGLILLSLFGLSQFDAGRRITYYTLWLMITLLVITHAQGFSDLFTPAILSSQSSNSSLSPQTGVQLPAPGVITPETVRAIPMSGR